MKKMTFKKIKGQGLSEYLIIVALIAVAAIAVVGLFGGAAQNQVAGLAAEISGGNGGAQITASQADATTASTQANTQNTLNDYNDQAAQINN